MINVEELKKLQEGLGHDNYIIEAINYNIMEAIGNGEYETVYSIDSNCDLGLEVDEVIQYYMGLGFTVYDDTDYEENEEYDEEADFGAKYCTKGTITISWK